MKVTTCKIADNKIGGGSSSKRTNEGKDKAKGL